MQPLTINAFYFVRIISLSLAIAIGTFLVIDQTLLKKKYTKILNEYPMLIGKIRVSVALIGAILASISVTFLFFDIAPLFWPLFHNIIQTVWYTLLVYTILGLTTLLGTITLVDDLMAHKHSVVNRTPLKIGRFRVHHSYIGAFLIVAPAIDIVCIALHII